MSHEHLSSTLGETKVSISGIVLAGGKSRRMGGINKALLYVGRRLLIERAIDRLASVIPDIILITNTPDEFRFLGLPMFGDLAPGHGSLGGLFTGLNKCNGAHGFLVGCDMPFLDERVIRHMVGLLDDYDVVIPRIREKLEPLHAIYSRSCLPHIRDLMQIEDHKIINLLQKVRVLEVPQRDLAIFDEDCRFVMNINTPEELEKAREIAESETWNAG